MSDSSYRGASSPHTFATAQDNALKTVCDLATIVTCACQLAYDRPGAGSDGTYEAAFAAAMVVVLVACILAVLVKICRLMVHGDTHSSWAHTVLAFVDATPSYHPVADTNEAESKSTYLHDLQRAMRKFCAVGVASARDQVQSRAHDVNPFFRSGNA